jgi:Coenzyme PQQ synthesis protein D (PqqD)
MRYSIPEGVLYQELPGEAVVLNLVTAEYFHLNSLGRAAWELIRLGVDRPAMEDALIREYDATPEQIRSDLEGFLKRMTELKLVTISEA